MYYMGVIIIGYVFFYSLYNCGMYYYIICDFVYIVND